MADTLTLRVLTPQRELYDETVEQVTAQGALGQFGVLPEHIAFLTTLEPGALSFRRPGGGEERLAVKGGYAEVRDNVMTVLADDAMPLAQIDVALARADLERAAAALETTPHDDPARPRLAEDVRWAEVRLALAQG
jgi:F-type H+-transporting ATPase subunit epsilon